MRYTVDRLEKLDVEGVIFLFALFTRVNKLNYPIIYLTQIQLYLLIKSQK